METQNRVEAEIVKLIRQWKKEWKDAVANGLDASCPAWIPNEPLYHKITQLWGDGSWIDLLDDEGK